MSLSLFEVLDLSAIILICEVDRLLIFGGFTCDERRVWFSGMSASQMLSMTSTAKRVTLRLFAFNGFNA